MNFGLERKKDTTIFYHIQLNIILKIFFPFFNVQKNVLFINFMRLPNFA
jgi:hypothetical protein